MMMRRCSHCSNNGHNSRTCPTRSSSAAPAASPSGGGGGSSGCGGGVRLFGVRLTDGSFMKKSASMGNLSLCHSSVATSSSPNGTGSPDPVVELEDRVDGYLSDDPNRTSCSSNRRIERKKGKPWTEEEHRLFLVGLQKLGKGDWRGIARNYVISRTPTQVASHAQKYFIRQSNTTRRKRRSSLFDMDMVTEEPQGVAEDQLLPQQPESREPDDTNTLPSLNLSLSSEAEPMEATSTEEVKETRETPALSLTLPPSLSAFYVPTLWQQSAIQPEMDNNGETFKHQVLKPTPVLRKEPVVVDELVGMSHLNLSEPENGQKIQAQLSLNLLGAPSRQSAFHASAPVISSELKEQKGSAIQAV